MSALATVGQGTVLCPASGTVQATISFKKSLAYFLVPIPTPADELLGIGYALKGIYQLAKIAVRELK